MADPSEITLVRDSGICYWNPVSASNLGTQLGYVDEGYSLLPNYKITPVTFETTGLIPQKYIYSGMVVMMRTDLINISVDTLKRALFQNFGSTLDFSLPGSVATGSDLFTVSNAGKILFVPNDARHPCFYSAACVAVLSPNTAIKIHYRQLTKLDITFFCASQRTALLSTLFPA